MADHGQRGRARRDGARGLAVALRREARAERPAFSASLHGRVLAAVAAESRVDAAGRRRRAAARIGGLVAAAAFAVGVAWFRPVPPAGFTAVVDSAPGIERLPTLDEIGEGVLAEVTTFAAAAVGVPEWADLATFDPTAFASADDAGR